MCSVVPRGISDQRGHPEMRYSCFEAWPHHQVRTQYITGHIEAMASCPIPASLMMRYTQLLMLSMRLTCPQPYTVLRCAHCNKMGAKKRGREKSLLRKRRLHLLLSNAWRLQICLQPYTICRCAYCNKRGATIGCRVERCAHSFHLHCARGAGCTFYPAKHVIACTTHASAFQYETEKDRQVCKVGVCCAL